MADTIFRSKVGRANREAIRRLSETSSLPEASSSDKIHCGRGVLKTEIYL